MPILEHKNPCKQCPLLKTSLRGWLGASTPQEFLDQINSEVHMPCHVAIDYESDEWEAQLEEAPHCAGSLIFLKNSCKRPRDPDLLEKFKQVETDDKVLSFNHNFLEHHTRKP